MSTKQLVPLQFVPVAALPGSPQKGDTVALSSNGHLYTYDGSAWVDNGAGGGSGPTTGTATVAFGATPGVSRATVTVSGQVGLTSSNRAQAWLSRSTTADHNQDEHELLARDSVVMTEITAPETLQISIVCDTTWTGDFTVNWSWI